MSTRKRFFGCLVVSLPLPVTNLRQDLVATTPGLAPSAEVRQSQRFAGFQRVAPGYP